jgi:hypothetical protein
MSRCARRKSAQTFLETRYCDATNEFVPGIDVENQDAFTRSAFLLRPIGRAHIEVAFHRGIGGLHRENGRKDKGNACEAHRLKMRRGLVADKKTVSAPFASRVRLSDKGFSCGIAEVE